MPQDVIDHVHALAHHQGAVTGLAFADWHSIPQDPNDLDPDNDDDSSYNPSEHGSDDSSHGSDDSSASSDADDDLDLAIDTNDITGVAEHDKKDEEPNDNNDRYIKIAGVNNNANNNEIAGVDADEQPPNDSYYPQDFYDKAVDDDDMPEPEDEVIHLDHPSEDNIPIVEIVEDEEDPHNALEYAMDEQYSTHTGAYDLHPQCARDYSHLLLHRSHELERSENGKDKLEPVRIVLQFCALWCVLQNVLLQWVSP